MMDNLWVICGSTVGEDVSTQLGHGNRSPYIHSQLNKACILTKSSTSTKKLASTHKSWAIQKSAHHVLLARQKAQKLAKPQGFRLATLRCRPDNRVLCPLTSTEKHIQRFTLVRLGDHRVELFNIRYFGISNLKKNVPLAQASTCSTF